ncbi:MAG: glycosyltransferase, partial [Chloroflexota bacterium]|nr:glycosyltransferase [Chloroflexota bacterium]
IGGVWDFCLTLVQALDARVTLLALGPESAEHRQAAARAGADVRFVPLKLEWMQAADRDVRRTREVVRDLVRTLRPDLVHANQFAAALAEIDVPVVLTVHSDVLSWRRWTLGASAADVPLEWAAYARLVLAALRAADRVVAVSRFLADQVRELYEFDQPIEVVHNGWPAPACHRPSSGTGGDGANGDGERLGTLLAGRAWDDAKNVGLAAAAAQGWDPGPVWLAGDLRHPDSDGLQCVEAPVQALGRLSRAELDERLRRAAIYLSPARYDPFGLLPLQAALHGATLLLSDIPSYRELWQGAACFFASDDPIDLRDKWGRLLANPAERAKLASAARARAAVYTPAAMASAYQRLYAGAGRGVAA